MDELRWDYYKELGYSKAMERSIAAKEGPDGVQRYWKPFEAHAVQRMLSEYRDCVFDFGAGHSVYEDEVLFEKVRLALEPYENVVLLLPSADLDESVRILSERIRADDPNIPEEVLRINAGFVKHRSNGLLAKKVVYTEDRTPEETCEEIIRITDLRRIQP